MGNENFYLTGGTATVEDTEMVIIPGGVKREWFAVLTGHGVQTLVIKEGINMDERYLHDGIGRVFLKSGRKGRGTQTRGADCTDRYSILNWISR
jgi:hypothetical protein